MSDVPPKDAVGQRIRFHYIKSPAFRVIHVNGVIGGWNGSGELHIATYSERPAIPQIMEHELLTETLGPAVSIEGKTGFVREIDVDLMLNRQRAIELRDWLNAKLEEFDKLTRDGGQK
jgi:hypothetical protein